MPLFTIIVPTYNRPDMLVEALDSVQQQTLSDFECIVVEDGPPRPAATVPDDPRFRLVRHGENRGLSAARNTGLEHAHGRYVTFLDDDDRLTVDRLECTLRLVGSDRVVVCGRQGTDGAPALYRNLQGRVYDSIVDGYPPHTGQVVVPLARTPRFDERYKAMEDVEWWLRLSRELDVVSVPSIGYLKRPHDGPRHGNGRPARAHGSRLFLEQYADYFRTHPRAKAFRLERLARLEAELDNRRAARVAAWQAVMARPQMRNLFLWLSLIVPVRLPHRLLSATRPGYLPDG